MDTNARIHQLEEMLSETLVKMDNILIDVSSVKTSLASTRTAQVQSMTAMINQTMKLEQFKEEFSSFRAETNENFRLVIKLIEELKK